MTREQKTSVIKALCLVGLISAIASGAWVSSMSSKAGANTTSEHAPPPAPDSADKSPEIRHYHIPHDLASQQLPAILKSVIGPENGLAIVHYHLPGNAESEELADTLNYLRKKYRRRLLVVRIGFAGHPVGLKKAGVDKLPHIMMIVGSEKVFEFQGLWSRPRVEQKVDQILHGLRKRIGKNWRPVVPGMTPMGK